MSLISSCLVILPRPSIEVKTDLPASDLTFARKGDESDRYYRDGEKNMPEFLFCVSGEGRVTPECNRRQGKLGASSPMFCRPAVIEREPNLDDRLFTTTLVSSRHITHRSWYVP